MNPSTFNSLNNVKFKFEIHRCPNINYWVQSVTLPSLSLENSVFPTIRRDIPIPGQKIEFEPLNVVFIVDQNLDNYFEIVNWFQQIQQSTNLSEMVSTGSLHFLDGNNKIIHTIDIVDMHPLMLSEIALNSDDSDTVPVTCSVNFAYRYFKPANTKPSWV